MNILAFFCSILFVSCLAAPIQLFPRALDISLRETRPETKAWHFGLVIHRPQEIVKTKGHNIPVYEHIHSLGSGCVEWDEPQADADNKRMTKPKHLKATARLTPVGESTDEELKNAVLAILRSVPGSKVTPAGNWNNCLDFAVEAARLLKNKNYISDEHYQRFKEVQDADGETVRELTNPGVLKKQQEADELKAAEKEAEEAKCKRGTSGNCNTEVQKDKLRKGKGSGGQLKKGGKPIAKKGGNPIAKKGGLGNV